MLWSRKISTFLVAFWLFLSLSSAKMDFPRKHFPQGKTRFLRITHAPRHFIFLFEHRKFRALMFRNEEMEISLLSFSFSVYKSINLSVDEVLLEEYICCFFQTFGTQMGLCQYLHDSSEPTVLNIVAPVHASFYLKNCINQRY